MKPSFLKYFIFPVFFLLVFQGLGRAEVGLGFEGEVTAAKNHVNNLPSTGLALVKLTDAKAIAAQTSSLAPNKMVEFIRAYSGNDFDRYIDDICKYYAKIIVDARNANKMSDVNNFIAALDRVRLYRKSNALGSDIVNLEFIESGTKVIIRKNGDDVGEIFNDLLHVKYAGLGEDVVCDAVKTTTCIGRWSGGTETIWSNGMAKQGSNPTGINILGEVDLSPPPLQVWTEQNKPWLEDAIARDDVMRAVSDPLDIDNVFHDALNIPTSVFSSPQSLATYLTSLNETSVEVSQLGYYGREIRHLFQQGYSFDTNLNIFIK